MKNYFKNFIANVFGIVLTLVIIFFSNALNASTDFSFAGEAIETNLNLSYNRARFYDPETGAFVTKDPIGISGGINTYQYSSNNPINFVDLLGLDPATSFFGGVKTVGGVFEVAAGESLVAAGTGVSATGVGAAVGVPGAILGGAVTVHGLDTVQSGFRQMMSGEHVDSFIS